MSDHGDPAWLDLALARLSVGDREAWLYARTLSLDGAVDAVMAAGRPAEAARLAAVIDATLRRGPLPGASLAAILDAVRDAGARDDAVWGWLSERGARGLARPVWAWWVSRTVEEELAQGVALAALNVPHLLAPGAEVAAELGRPGWAAFLAGLDREVEERQLVLAALRAGPLEAVARWLDTDPFATWERALAGLPRDGVDARADWLARHEGVFRSA